MNQQPRQSKQMVISDGHQFGYENYVEGYNMDRNMSEPVQLSTFEGNIEKAINFYYNQVNKLYFSNTLLNNKLRAALQQKKQIADQIANLEEIQKDDTEDKKKRVRRCANQIQRKYICTVKGCEKSYGTQGSMAQHMKLKHPQVQYILPSEAAAAAAGVSEVSGSSVKDDKQSNQREESIIKKEIVQKHQQD